MVKTYIHLHRKRVKDKVTPATSDLEEGLRSNPLLVTTLPSPRQSETEIEMGTYIKS